jgi:hypothetical protein
VLHTVGIVQVVNGRQDVCRLIRFRFGASNGSRTGMLCSRPTMKDLLSESWVGSVIGVVGILAGLAIAYYFRARPRLASQVNSLELLGNNPVLPKEIDFLFRGQKGPQGHIVARGNVEHGKHHTTPRTDRDS